MNWDDLKYFLAVCRNGSIRSAAKELGVNHATVSRRINSFEKSLGQRLFERTTKGYLLTKIGEEILSEASNLEERLSSVDRLVAGKDTDLVGEVRVTLPDMLAQDLLMPAFAKFCHLYPQIQIEVVDSTKVFNLSNREADVAFRLCDLPPEHLIGRKLAVVHRACYIASNLIPMLNKEGWLAQQNWIGWTDKLRKPIGKIAKEYPRLTSKHKIISGILQATACKYGLGIAILPCFYADNDPDLSRIPPYSSEGKYDLWILSHPDLRRNAKIQTFVRFMTEHLLEQRALIEGETFIIN